MVPDQTSNEGSGSRQDPIVNPLTRRVSFLSELRNRLRLFDWWVDYHKGRAYESILRDRIIQLGMESGFADPWLRKILRHAISEFSKKGLGPDYYGYHNIDHELEAVLFTLIAARGQVGKNGFTTEELWYLLVAALFHDYDPKKRFDKPHEDAVEQIVRRDAKIRRFINDVGLDINIVIAMIYRTAYPFQGENAAHALNRMSELFTAAGIPEGDSVKRQRYSDMGWFLSVCERVAGYALGDFEHSKDLARRNAHALIWNPSVINERSVQYFTALTNEKAMFDRVMAGVPESYKKTFFDNVKNFNQAWNKESELRQKNSNQVAIRTLVETNRAAKPPSEVIESVMEIFDEQSFPMRTSRQVFLKSLSNTGNILVTLRAGSQDDTVVGYAKGGPLEKCKLRKGTIDSNFGKHNTSLLEGVVVRRGFLGATGGHLLRLKFFDEAANRGYEFVTGYAHRDVIIQRIKKGEKIEMVQKYDPDMLDYYRANLTDDMYRTILSDSNAIYVDR